jgi:hypothetical protein
MNKRENATSTLMDFKGERNIINTSLPKAFLTQVKLTISLEDTIHQISHTRKLTTDNVSRLVSIQENELMLNNFLTLRKKGCHFSCPFQKVYRVI